MLPFLSVSFIVEYLVATLRMSTPLMFAASGELVSERAGVLNLGLEGMMLIGSFAGAVAALYTGSPLVGLLAAMLAGSLVGLIQAVLAVTVGADQVVTGFALNLFALGITGFFFRATFGITTIQATIPTFKPIEIPMLSDLPVLGPVVFSQTVLTYLAFAIVLLLSYLLFKTSFGLAITAVGEHPKAADTVGINVYLVRYLATVFAGAMAGAGGAFLTVGQLGTFVENITAGRGFIALAAVIFGNWRPLRMMGACLLFGAADALQIRIQAMGVPIPYQFFVALPYIVTLVAIAGFVGRVRSPAGLAIPYSKD